MPVLAKLLKHASTPVRGHAATAIGRFGGAAQVAVPQLAEALQDDDATIRAASARALGSIGPNAKAAVSALAAALDDEIGTVTIAAAEALGAIGKAAVPALVERLKDPNLNSLAATILGEIGPDAAAAVPRLVKLLSADDEATKTEALLALAAIGPNAIAAAPELLSLLNSKAKFGRGGAAYVLAKIGAKTAIPLLTQTINEEGYDSLQMASAWALVTLAPDNADFARLAVPHLTAGLSSKRSLVRREAADALGRIGGPAEAAVPSLVAALNDPAPDVRAEAVVALAKIGSNPTENVPRVARLLNDPVVDVRYAAVFALGTYGPKAKVIAPVLLNRMMTSRDTFERTVAAWAAVRIAPSLETNKAALPLMVAALELSSPEGRVAAARTLGIIGINSKAAIIALKKATQDKDETVREAAASVLKKIDK